MSGRARLAGAALVAAILGLALAACPRGGGAPAEPAPVELEWPDAGQPPVIAPTPPASAP